jgi:ABC-2 type transport system ATP-binding protein
LPSRIDLPLSAERLSKKYPTRLGLAAVRALQEVSFTVSEGEILGFLGPNGAGKTTAIKCILGLLRPSGGRVSLWGSPPAHPSVRKRVGYVPESPDYDDSFTPVEFLDVYARMRGLDRSRKKQLKLLQRVGLSGWERTRIRRFSKGMRQRASLALALQSAPDLLILDEPTGGLDPIARAEFRDIVLEEHVERGVTVFLSSHLLSEVETVCTRAMILNGGKVVREGTMEDLLAEEDLCRIEFEGAPPANLDNDSLYELPADAATGSVEAAHGLLVAQTDVQKTIDILRSAGATLTRLEKVYGRLEDVFLRATRDREPDDGQGSEVLD